MEALVSSTMPIRYAMDLMNRAHLDMYFFLIGFFPFHGDA